MDVVLQLAPHRLVRLFELHDGSELLSIELREQPDPFRSLVERLDLGGAFLLGLGLLDLLAEALVGPFQIEGPGYLQYFAIILP